MDTNFWLTRWQDGRTNFHQTRVTPLLQKYWPTLELPSGSTVLVPLCGKSRDMVWLAEQGFRVVGVELSQLAVEQFFAENALHPKVHQSAHARHYVTERIEIICGDIFKVDAAVLAACTGVYDRGALVALPPAMRKAYVHDVYGQLSRDYQGILITLDYAQEQMAGPPFSVPDSEVQTLYAPHSDALVIDRRDILDKEPKFIERGLSALMTVVYCLRGKAKAPA